MESSTPRTDQPAMYTELWTGWFQHWGQPKFTRFAEDTAFSAARFIAKGGTYLGYYMWHGGTNFGRWGSDFKTTSYDYDAMLNEYGFPNNPKHNHIVDLNHVLLKFKHLILDNTPKHIPLGSPSVEAHIYGNSASESLVFISNNSTSNDIEVSIDFLGGSRRTMVLPHWSVLIYHSTSNSYELVFNTVSPRPSAHSMKPLQIEHSSSKLKQESIALMRIRPETSDLRVNAHVSAISYIEEPIGIWNYSLATLNAHPIEHIKATQYTSDYLWYVCEEITLSRKDTKIRVEIEGLEDIGYVYFDGIRLNQQPIVRRESDKDKSVTIEFDGVDHRIREHKLSLLVAVVGLTELGVYIERIHKGLRGAVKINGIDISNGKWFHQTGLLGENQMYHLGSKSLTPSMWKSFETAQFKDTSLTWFRVLFPKRDLLVMQKKAIQTYIHSATHSRSFGTGIEPISAFVLNLGTMSRGIAFVNGNGVQRFWNLKAVCENVSCHYPDGISDPIEGERCAVGCGYASQSWYNVPTAWIEDSGWDDVEVVVFDEAGGNPSGISIAAIVG
ncbi:hypothetical protein BCR33DRAFT_343823 [Rhizoclosmatium globosum]|uniref:Glycoside hydrolase 35 catalytic domain-containing protein n=1 Tax=Rhizoclosmatium globosum TaxID=329046 RepID=A0A1Y2C4P3_9FUNG|nr:hypothetical protein BCR33DRAFT_343823 [Rhizoclosmatium globosum]|eukprot:ORY41295.1 hypothetical protein BCR33DRAFT_343823 [Rhizoclosmatium globosum]